ncbi:hypothetical protein [Variovorax sp. ZT4R33]|uniref:hypothetical protein n=1 Tax=Variovorax sp. ZT4R33 TaxID=3443743 RepID=UPI003F48688A
MRDDFINVEDHGEWLNFRFREVGETTSIPVKMSREALTDHFGAGSESGELVKAYAQNQEEIHAVVRTKAKGSGPYTVANPLELRTADF